MSINRREFLKLNWSSENLSVVEQSSEWAVFGLLVANAYRASSKDRFTYIPKSEKSLTKTEEYEKLIPKILSLREGVADVLTQLQALSRAWEKKYKTTQYVPKVDIQCDSDGKCETVITMVEEEVWSEPSQYTSKGVDRFSIAQQISYYRGLIGKLDFLSESSANSFDFSNGGSATYLVPKTVSGGSRKIQAGVVYSAIALAYANYEEIISRIQEDGGNIRGRLDNQNISRRSLFKIGGASMAIWLTNYLQGYFGDKNKDLQNLLNEKNVEVARYLDLSVNDQLSLLFSDRYSVENILDTSGNTHKLFGQDLPDLDGMGRYFVDIANNAVFMGNSCNTLFFEDPAGLGFVVANTVATEGLLTAAGNQNALSVADHHLTAGVVFAALAGYAFSTERILEMSDKIHADL